MPYQQIKNFYQSLVPELSDEIWIAMQTRAMVIVYKKG